MYPHALVILGIPIDDLTPDETIQAILKHIQNFSSSKKTQYVGFINSKELANIWNWCGEVVNREHLSMILKAQYILPTDKQLVWVSKAIGDPLQAPVNELEFIQKLCNRLAGENKSLFFLGKPDSKKFIDQIKADNPSLRVLGTETPHIRLEGSDLLNMDDLDEVLIDELNQLAPDVLWIDLGSPKQEIWFKRVKRRLKIPVVIGTNLVEDSSNTGMFAQVGSWGKQLFQSGKFGLASLPLICVQNLNRMYYSREQTQDVARDPLLFLSKDQSFVVFSLPKILNQQTCDEIVWQMRDAFEHPRLIFDFRQVKSIDPHGLSCLLATMTRIWREKKDIYAWGASPFIKYLLKLNRIWYLLEPYFFNSPQDFIKCFASKGEDKKERENLYLSIQQKKGHVIVSFFGFLGNQINYAEYLQSWIPMIEEKGCVLDFTYCLAIDSRGLGFLLQIKEYLQQHKQSLKICGLSKCMAKTFNEAKVDQYFRFYPNLEAALAKA